jgi:hypothetical protein
VSALPSNSISTLCRAVRDHLAAEFNGQDVDVVLGTPAANAPGASDSNAKNTVVLFFHRFGPAGFGTDTTPADPWRIRLHCLITAFGIDESGPGDEKRSAGENELWLIGEVIRVFHETPVLPEVEVTVEREDDELTVPVRLQVIFQPLTLDDINHLWSTQGSDVTYRPSVLYEMALAPVLPRGVPVVPRLAGAVGLEARPSVRRTTAPPDTRRVVPPVTAVTVATTSADWTPRICFVRAGACEQSLAFEVGSPELDSFEPRVWVAGDVDSTVTLAWEQWTPTGWTREGLGTQDVAPVSDSIDPDHPPEEGDLPFFDLPATDEQAQFLLYAERTFTPAGGGAPRTVRSNPLLVTLYETP